LQTHILALNAAVEAQDQPRAEIAGTDDATRSHFETQDRTARCRPALKRPAAGRAMANRRCSAGRGEYDARSRRARLR
jgi:DNA-binding response OmpR family regulator